MFYNVPMYRDGALISSSSSTIDIEVWYNFLMLIVQGLFYLYLTIAIDKRALNVPPTGSAIGII